MHHELIIVGGGPAGLTAGLYAARARIDTLVLESTALGGQMLNTYQIDNWPGDVHGISGYELAQRMREHAQRFGLRTLTAGLQSLALDGRIKTLQTDKGHFTCDAVIISTGARPVTLGIPGEEQLTGKGVSYCATCDAPFYRNQRVAVIGGGNSAVEEALYLTRFTDKVKLIHRRDELRANRILQEELDNSPVELILSHVPLRVEGQGQVNGLWLKNLKNSQEQLLDLDGIFVFVGSSPQTGFHAPGLEKDDAGFILTDQLLQTSLPGVFAAGDCRENPLKQVVTAAGEGALAAHMAQKFLETK